MSEITGIRNEEIRTIRINSTTGIFEFNNLMFITCEYGEKNNKSFQRILINGKEVERYLYSGNLCLAEKIKLVGSTIGADLKGENCSPILLKTSSVAHTTFTQKEVISFMNIVNRYLAEGGKFNLKDFGYLNCDYYFKVKQDTNLEKIKIGT